MSLNRIVTWSQQLAGEVLRPGDLAIDLTIGKGRDTLTLARAVGASGQVVGCDIQAEALDLADELLQMHGCLPRRSLDAAALTLQAGIDLVLTCHSRLAALLPGSPRVVMANLGYLPGGDPALITRPETTLQALRLCMERLAPGGRLLVSLYPGHPGGDAEACEVAELFARLPGNRWQTLCLGVPNAHQSPGLLVAERI